MKYLGRPHWAWGPSLQPPLRAPLLPSGPTVMPERFHFIFCRVPWYQLRIQIFLPKISMKPLKPSKKSMKPDHKKKAWFPFKLIFNFKQESAISKSCKQDNPTIWAWVDLQPLTDNGNMACTIRTLASFLWPSKLRASACMKQSRGFRATPPNKLSAYKRLRKKKSTRKLSTGHPH